MLFSSIRFKITILYMVILAVTLTAFNAILYHNVKLGLNNNMDTLLKSKAGGIAQAIDTYWEASRLEAIESGIATTELARKRRNVNFSKVAQRWVKEESTDPGLIDIIVQVFDTDGVIIASSKNTHGLAEISRKNFITVLQGKPRFDTISQEGNLSNRMVMRVYTTPVFEHEKVAYIVQISSPASSIQVALNSLKMWLLLLFPVTVFVAGTMGAFLAKATLHPVDNMIRTIHQITAQNMKLKIAIPGTRDEIQKLAETFNDMLERLERAFSSQRQLFEDLSHELKTPLTILKGEFEVALKNIRSQDEYKTILNSALEEVNKVIKLAENLLLLAKFDSREVLFKKSKIDLGLLIQAVANNLKNISELNQIKMVVDVKERVLLEADESQLKTLFLNILDNAIKYTPTKGSVNINMQKTGSFVRVSVQDTGVGIPEDEIGHIFDRFYRVDKSRSRMGFGLGLSIAKSIVDAHKGTISVESKPGQGTTFNVTIPI